MQLRHRLVRNSIATLFQLGVTTICGLILPPILIYYLGLETYGVWSLMVLINAYVALLDLGFGSSLIKYIAEADAKGDKRQIKDLLNVCLTIYVGIYAVSLGLLLFLNSFIFSALLGNAAQPDLLWPFTAYASITLTGLITVPFSSLLKGLQRQDQSNVVETAAMVLGTSLSIFLISSGWRLGGLVAGTALSMFTRFSTYMLLSRGTYNLFHLRWVGYSMFKAGLRSLMHLSAADNSVRLYNVVTQTVIRISINAFAGVAYVGIYDLAKRVVSQISGISSVVFVPLMPAVSSLVAQKRFNDLVELLDRCHLYLSIIGLPFVYFLLFFYEPIMTAWLRVDDVAAISFAGRVLLIASTIDIFTGPSTTSAVGLGTARLQLIKMLVTATLSVLLTIVLGHLIGFTGILMAELAAMTTGALIGFWLFQRWFQIFATRMILRSLWRTTIVSVPVWFLLGAGWFLTRHNFVWRSLLSWAILLAVGGALTVILYWANGLLSSYEIDVARAALIPGRFQTKAARRQATESS